MVKVENLVIKMEKIEKNKEKFRDWGLYLFLICLGSKIIILKFNKIERY